MYDIDFTRFCIRDLESGTVLFEIAKPLPPGMVSLFFFCKTWLIHTYANMMFQANIALSFFKLFLVIFSYHEHLGDYSSNNAICLNTGNPRGKKVIFCHTAKSGKR